ncbi:MAG: hypothetical protein JNM51_00530, partial [Bacteroidia bacterium]|nr:hypothetical protein [Bacteroidia bacterium]
MLKQLFLVITFFSLHTAFSQDNTIGITSPIHQKYIGKIAFSNNDNDLAKGKENEAGFKSEFNLGEPIYFRVYLKDALLNTLRPITKFNDQNTFNRDSRFTLKVYLDGKHLDSLFSASLQSDDFYEDDKKTWTTFRGAFKSVDNSVYIGTYMFKELLTKYERLLT